MSLHPEVLALIASYFASGNAVQIMSRPMTREALEGIALRAVELEREEILSICASVTANWNASVAEGSEIDGYETTVIASIESAIRRRGKP